MPADSGGLSSLSGSHCVWPTDGRESRVFITQRKAHFSLTDVSWNDGADTCLHFILPAGAAAPLCIKRIF